MRSTTCVRAIAGAPTCPPPPPFLLSLSPMPCTNSHTLPVRCRPSAAFVRADLNSLGLGEGPLWDVACVHVWGNYTLQYTSSTDGVQISSERRPEMDLAPFCQLRLIVDDDDASLSSGLFVRRHSTQCNAL